MENRQNIRIFLAGTAVVFLFLVCFAMVACISVVTVSFDTRGGSAVENQYLSGGSYATQPDDPTKTGHTFTGWFGDEDITKPFDFEGTHINKNTVIYAGWDTNLYTITFVSEGTAVDSITLPYGSTPETVESYRTGFVFDGWFLDITRLTRYTPTAMPDHSFTLYAGWTQDKDYSAFTFEKNQSGYTLTAVRDLKLDLLTVPDSFDNQPVTRVGRAAFSSARQITKIEIPDTVDFVDESAFEGCLSLVTAKLPALFEISPRLFYGCTKLSNIDLPEEVQTIGESAFLGCLSLTEISLPQNLVEVGGSAFAGSGLKSIAIPSTVTELSSNLFYNAASLTDVTLVKGLTYIGSGVFEKCTALKSITVPQGVTEIGSRAFALCGQLTDISLPKSLVKTGDYLFFDCQSLAKIDLPPLLATVGNYTFLKCVSLKKVTMPTALTALACGFFDGCVLLDDITLPEGLLTIGEGAFLGCASLKSLLLPADLASVGGGAFYGCTTLATLDTADGLDDSLRNVGGQAFFGTAWLNSFPKEQDVYLGRVLCRAGTRFTEFKENTLSIAGLAFAGRKDLSAVVLPLQLEIIGDSAFESSGLESIDLPSSVLSIGEKSFKNCKSLQEISMKDGLLSIGDDAFYGCAALLAAHIPATTRQIGNAAFFGCTLLAAATLPDNAGFQELSSGLFSGCTALLQISIPSSVKTVGSKAFYGCSALASVDLGQGVTFIEISAFENCVALSDIDFPASLLGIMAYAFRNTRLTNITLGKGVSVIGEQTFTTLYTKSNLYAVLPPDLDTGFEPFGIVIRIEGSPQISHSFDMGVHTRIILPDSLHSQIMQDKMEKIHLENWRMYKLYVYSHSMKQGDFLIDGGKLAAYLGGGDTGGDIGSGEDIDIPQGIVIIAPYAFYDYAGDGQINLTSAVTTIGTKAFFGCKNITAINNSDGITNIGQSAFAGMKSLSEITLASTVTTVGALAFDGCDLLSYIYCGVLEARRPSGWSNAWLGDCKATVLWGQTST